jgi:hypothetical protein
LVDLDMPILEFRYDPNTGKETVHYAEGERQGEQLTKEDYGGYKSKHAYRCINFLNLGVKTMTMHIFRGWKPPKQGVAQAKPQLAFPAWTCACGCSQPLVTNKITGKAEYRKAYQCRLCGPLYEQLIQEHEEQSADASKIVHPPKIWWPEEEVPEGVPEKDAPPQALTTRPSGGESQSKRKRLQQSLADEDADEDEALILPQRRSRGSVRAAMAAAAAAAARPKQPSRKRSLSEREKEGEDKDEEVSAAPCMEQPSPLSDGEGRLEVFAVPLSEAELGAQLGAIMQAPSAAPHDLRIVA